MAPRKRVKKEELSEGESDDAYSPEADPESGSDYEAEEPKAKAKAKPRGKAKAAAEDEDDDYEGGAKPKRKRAPKPKKVTEVTHLEDGWVLHPPSIIYKTNPQAQGGTKVACFDFDGTLVGIKSGAKWPKDENDWRFFNKDVPKVLRELHDEGYQLLIVSNQGGIKGALSGAASTKMRGRVSNMIAALAKKGEEELPVQFICATQKDEFRKPEPGMWQFFAQHMNGGVQPDLGQSFYCGDMAGRPTDIASKEGEPSTSDRDFATNVGLAHFFTPEEKFGEPDIKKDLSGAAPSDTGENGGLVDAFRKLAGLQSDGFKRNAYNKVAEALAAISFKVTAAKDVKDIKGIGKSSLAKITEFLETGTLAALSEAGIDMSAPADRNAEMALKFL